MKKSNFKKLLAFNGSVLALALIPTKADAFGFFSPCMLIGSPMPPPCIVLDYKKLADVAISNAQELQKIKETVETVKQTKAASEGIVSQVRNAADFNINLGVDIGLPNADGLAGPILKGFSGGIREYASKAGESFYSGSGSSVEASQAVVEKRKVIEADGIAEAYAYSNITKNEIEETNARFANLAKKACQSKDLRTDWLVNSQIKMEMINLQSKQSYLMSSFLRMQTAVNVKKTDADQPKAIPIGTIVALVAAVAVKNDQSDKIREMRDLYSKALSLTTSFQVVEMASKTKEELNLVVEQYNQAVKNTAQKRSEFVNAANQWYYNESSSSRSKCQGYAQGQNRSGADFVVNLTEERLNQLNISTSAKADQTVEALSSEFAERGISSSEINAMQTNNVDYRFVIGGWADATKNDDAMSLATSLASDNGGALKYCLKGDENSTDSKAYINTVAGYETDYNYYGNALSQADLNAVSNSNETKDLGLSYVYKRDGKIKQYFKGYNDLVLEEAWKLKYKNEAEEQLKKFDEMIDQEKANSKTSLTGDSVKGELSTIAARFNQLSQEVASSNDTGAKQTASDLTKQFNDYVSSRVSLPANPVEIVDVNQIGGTAVDTSTATGTDQPVDQILTTISDLPS